jgi:DNA-binding SARP family transcriptional activator
LIPVRNRDGSVAICQTFCMGAGEPTLRILGSLEVVGPAGPVRLGAAKERCLLAVLALHPGEAVSQDRLAEALWGEQAPRSAANALQNYVLRLRRALQAAEGVQVVTDPAGYRLQAPADVVDARLAERLIAEGREAAAAGDAATAARLLGEALALWRGRALAEFTDQPFAQAEAARLEELRESAREDLADAELALGRHHDLVGELEAMVASHPLRERRWGQLLLARYRDGRQAEALEGFRTLRRTLREELGVDPGPELQDLHDRILHQDPALAWRPTEQARAPAAVLFYGRDEELRRLLGVYDTAAAGGGGVVTVVGEPGIGKTRLLQELAASVRQRGALVLSGRCLEGGWVPPYQAFVEAITGYAAEVSATGLRADLGPAAGPLAQLVPGLRERLRDLPTAAPLQPDEERLRLLDAVARFLVGLAAHGPVVLVLDDLQWADASTLVTLRHVARFAVRQRLLLVGAYRSGEAGPDLVDALGALRAEADMVAVHLRGLDADALGRLLGAVAEAPVSAELAGAIQQETRGNPFFAREVIRHLLETRALRVDADGALHADLPLEAVPEGLRDVLARRRARLPPDANRFLDTAAGFDGPFPFAVVAEVAELGDAALAALDELLQAGLVEPDVAPERYQFGHALIRQAVYAELNPSRQVRLHRRLAHALQAARAGSLAGVAPGEVAAQYQRSAVLAGAEAGVAPALEAAEQAQAASAHAEAASFLQVACELAAPGDPRLPRLRARLGLALAWALRLDEAVQVARAAAAELAAAEGRQAAAGYLAEVTSAFTNADSAGHAWQLVPQGLAYAGERHDAVWASLALLDLDRREASDPEYPGIVLDVPERREAVRILHRAGALTGRVDLLRYAIAAIYGRREYVPAEVAEDSTVRLFLLGDYAGALPHFAAEAAEAHARGQLAREAYCHGCLARCHIALGQLEAGRAALAEAHAVADRIAAGPWGWQRVHAIAGPEHALVLATDEGWEDLLSLVAEFSGTRAHVVRWAQSSFDAVMAVAQARLGRPDRALQLLAAVVPALRRAAPWAFTYLRTVCDAAETLWLLDRRDHLPVIEAALRDKALAADFRFPMVDARLALARLCAVDGRHDQARRWFAKARTVLDAQGARPLRAIVDYDEALMHRRAGHPDAARPLLDAAAGQFARLGMAGWLRRASAVGTGR